MNELVKDCIRKIMQDIKEDCIEGCESYYLRYEFFNMLEYLDWKEIDYDQRKMNRLLDKLDEKVCREYRCISYCKASNSKYFKNKDNIK